MPKLIVATSNPGKLREMQAYLSGSSWELSLKPAELDVDETGTTFATNACLKASEVAIALNEWAIADDSGLQVDALNGAPGIYSARYADTDKARIDRLLQELADFPEPHQRQAQFVCAVAVARPDGTIVAQAEGICRGEILTAPRGVDGFGYDPIFYVPSKQLAFAEMSVETKRSISHRGIAFGIITQKLAEIAAGE
ncbi:RdgB/HAM1 family non-canonical purine NTP pyrophosphatase [Chamaesiphon minutus]|uniref:dITP/XTP pyrophosphatase n=1 Tax=Chamaesiphon minutus (strain ATCC 27169 / PCC 6605) TaxID=1173020 RepID=K9UMV2_CHAP6|nr:RdgB/HAM1 family non-canonical purine NTP pyrophosphatase [Chamaesiphon minutus]AFY96427.1 non-canonical purine NTP pyrophosphatase, rdgB/HAM1 family [Chamaesiphon minutus PCC 6605]